MNKAVKAANSLTREEALSWRLNSFKPSDREEFQRAFNSPQDSEVAYNAILLFVGRLEKDPRSVEEYSLERLGRWVAREVPPAMVAPIRRWSRERKTKARLAFNRGLREVAVIR